MKKTALLICGVAVGVSACGSSSTTTVTEIGGGGGNPSDTVLAVGSAEKSAQNEYTVTQGARTTTLPAGGFTLNGQRAWSSGGFRAGSYESADVLAIGGVAPNEGPFAGITGTPTTPTTPTTGDATYTGNFGVNNVNGNGVNGQLSLAHNFNANTITNNGGNLTVAGTVDGAAISGTVTYEGETADLTGGFYGTDGATVAGAFNSDEIGGILYGERQAP